MIKSMQYCVTSDGFLKLITSCQFGPWTEQQGVEKQPMPNLFCIYF